MPGPLPEYHPPVHLAITHDEEVALEGKYERKRKEEKKKSFSENPNSSSEGRQFTGRRLPKSDTSFCNLMT